jgi:hypothetical protein
MSPPFPLVAEPVVYDILPAEPLLEVPLIKFNAPLTPDVPALILLRTKDPDVTCVATPVRKDTEPPVLVSDRPDLILIDPPGRLPPAPAPEVVSV